MPGSLWPPVKSCDTLYSPSPSSVVFGSSSSLSPVKPRQTTCLVWAASASPVALAQIPMLLQYLWGISVPSLQLHLHSRGRFTVL